MICPNFILSKRLKSLFVKSSTMFTLSLATVFVKSFHYVSPFAKNKRRLLKTSSFSKYLSDRVCAILCLFLFIFVRKMHVIEWKIGMSVSQTCIKISTTNSKMRIGKTKNSRCLGE